MNKFFYNESLKKLINLRNNFFQYFNFEYGNSVQIKK